MLITWMPYPNMRLSVHVLSSQMLGVQISQAVLVLRVIAGHREGGANKYHRTVLSWWSYPEALTMYLHYCVQETAIRGQDRGIPSPLSDEGVKLFGIPKQWRQSDPRVPDWFGIERLHACHRATLLNKDYGWYKQFGWDETPVHTVFIPPPLPKPGDSVARMCDGTVFLVHCLDEKGRPMVAAGSEPPAPVERVEFYSGRWRRCVVSRD